MESVFQNWRVQEEDRIQEELNKLSARFVAQANGILSTLEAGACSLLEIQVEHLSISCPLRMESRLSYKVERVFHSLHWFQILLPRFLMHQVVLRRMCNNVPLLLDMNSGRIRNDFIERLHSSTSQFEKNLCGSIAVVTQSLSAALRRPGNSHDQRTLIAALDAVMSDCRRLLRHMSAQAT